MYKFAEFKKPSKRALVIGGVVIVASGLMIGGIAVYRHNNTPTIVNRSGRQAASQVPDYKTITPANKSIKDLGGWSRVSPPDKAPVFAYNDKINDTTINVSQQKIPTSFKKDINSGVAEMAKKFNATNKITVAGQIVYIGTSHKGPQYAIWADGDLLIMIKSSQKLDDKTWSNYITSLK